MNIIGRNTGYDSGESDRQLRRAHDPSAGSPTETLLRFLLPRSDKVRPKKAFPLLLGEIQDDMIQENPVVNRPTQVFDSTCSVILTTRQDKMSEANEGDSMLPCVSR